ncbi:MAG: PKD domain-containing protein, partial [Deltaproteobacteria bacterium]|nr:PKD domain-containing protein [Deltaproteobacteria bacterium]
MKRTKRGSMGCRRVVPLFASIITVAGWFGSGPARAAAPAVDYSSQVTVTAANQRSVADRRTNTITSDADLTLKNGGATAIGAPLWAVIKFSAAGVSAPTQSGTWKGPAGSWNPARPYYDLSGSVPQGLQPGASVTFHVKFVCASAVRYTYQVLTYGAAAPTQNHSPTANAGGPYAGNVGQAIAFSGSGSDPDNDTLSYSGAFGDGGTASVAAPTHVYVTGGPFVATLTVTDGKGGIGSSTATVTVDRPPTAVAGGPYSGNVGQAISFDGSGSGDPDGPALTYAWDFGDGGTGAGVSATHVYTDTTRGSFTATLTVTDPEGLSASSTATVTVNRPPTANAGGPYSGNVGQAISFSGSGNDPDDDTLAYSWAFGDGGTASVAAPTHVYAAGG